MDVPQLSPQLIDALRTWFHPKDRSVYLAPSTFAYLPGGIGYLSMAFISETILSASAASVTFSNIPQSFRHLILFCQPRTDSAVEAAALYIFYNNDTGANYDAERLIVAGTTVSAATLRSTNGPFIGLTEGSLSRANNFGLNFIIITNYQTTMEKQAIAMSCTFGDASADGDLLLLPASVRWRNTNVITSILLNPNVGSFVSGSRFQLYGVL